MNKQDAIHKAIKGGWYWKTTKDKMEVVGGDAYNIDDYFSTLLDPSFWKCLGKEMGWKQVEIYIRENPDYPEGESIIEDGWLYQWHRLIDHLAGGGTIDSYFETL